MRLHHIGFLTPELERAAVHFRDAFGYVIESEPIQDHGQAATVQFLRQPGAAHWLELVSPLGEASSLWNAVGRGTSLHHQCYEIPDIEEGIASLRARGCLPLGRPQPGAAFDRRPIVWLMDGFKGLIELVEAGAGARSLAVLERMNRGLSDA